MKNGRKRFRDSNLLNLLYHFKIYISQNIRFFSFLHAVYFKTRKLMIEGKGVKNYFSIWFRLTAISLGVASDSFQIS